MRKVGKGIFIVLFPPPAPLHFVKLHLDSFTALQQPAIAVYIHNVHLVVLTGKQHSAHFIAIGCFNAIIIAVHMIRDTEIINAEITTCFKYLGGKIGP
ncbi:hypothetical protein D3C87_1768080 [compost metagenome]